MTETKREPRIAFVFPGQGSQMVGMGHDLVEISSQAKQVFEEADEALGFELARLCFEGPEDVLRDTVNSQPAILTASIACLRAATELNGSLSPALVAGHSLGEYTALVAANALDFADALRLVRKRGRLMQDAGKQAPGCMAAIIGLDLAIVEEICLQTNAQIANINCPGQVVISGTEKTVGFSTESAMSKGCFGTVPLEVSAAFHSTLMQPAIEGMAEVISQVNFRTPEVPIVANSTAVPITTVDEIKDELIQQLCNCVLWQPSVEYMVRDGINTFIEVGPGIVLTKLIKRIARKAKALNMGDVESIREIVI